LIYSAAWNVVEALGPSEYGLNQEHGKVVLFDLAAVGYVHPKIWLADKIHLRRSSSSGRRNRKVEAL
jgi:hypothetical protein